MGLNPESVRAIVFDFDGMLVDSMGAKADAFCALYADQPSSVLASIRDFHFSHGGLPRSEKFEYFETKLLGRPLDAARIEWLSERFGELVEPLVVSAPEIHGATRLLESLLGRLPLFVASATPEAELHRIVEARGWARYFTAIYGSPCAKEMILRKIGTRIGVRTVQLLFVGDSRGDLRAATIAGTQFLGFRNEGKNSFGADVRTIEKLETIKDLKLRSDTEAGK